MPHLSYFSSNQITGHPSSVLSETFFVAPTDSPTWQLSSSPNGHPSLKPSSLPPSKDLLTTLTETLQEFMNKLMETTQDTVGIIAWHNSDIPHYNAILDPSHCPSILGKLLVYSPWIFFPGKVNKPNTVYTKLHIAHAECLFTDIQSQLSFWLRSNSHGMYYNMLQAESVIN